MRIATLLMGVFAILVVGLVFAGVPTKIYYQGRLTDSGGNVVGDGSYTVTLTVYKNSTGGTGLWSSGPREVLVTDGLFSAILGDSITLYSDLFANDSDLWLGIQVESDPEMTPRSLMTSAPKSAVSSGVYGDIKTSRGSLVLEDGGGFDSSIVIVNEAKALDHRGHVTILKISNNGSDSTELLRLSADTDNQSFSVGDGNSSDSGIVLTGSAQQLDHRGHVTILKISNNGSDTTELMSLSADTDDQSFSVGDGNSSDSGIVLTGSAQQLDHRGHVTILKISNNGSDTTTLMEMVAQPLSQSLSMGEGDSPDSGIVLTNSVDKTRHRGHVTILKISNNGSDTTEMMEMVADPSKQSLSMGEGDSPDSGIVLTNSVDKTRHRGHVTILKISNNGSDTTNMASLNGDPVLPSLVVGDGKPTDSGIVVTNSVEMADHRGHVTILKISNGGGDTTGIVSIDGDEDQASIQLNGGGGSGGSIYLLADAAASSGKIGVNTLSPTYEVDVVGTICATNGLCQQSDQRFKEDIQSLSGVLPIIRRLNPVRYSWRREQFPDRQFSEKEQLGFIAQEVSEILPEVVSLGTDGFYSLDYARLTPVLVQGLKEQQTEIEFLQKRLEQLEAVVTKLTSATGVSPQLGLK